MQRRFKVRGDRRNRATGKANTVFRPSARLGKGSSVRRFGTGKSFKFPDFGKLFRSAGRPGSGKNKKRIAGVAAVCGAAALTVFLCFGPPQLLGTFAEAAPGDQSVHTQAEQTAAPTTSPASTAAPTPVPTPEPTPDPTLTEGMESAEVNRLQERLMSLGYLDIDESTSYYGPATAYAVAMFQRQHGLEMDGVCGPKTLEIIYTDEARPYTLLEGTQGNDVDMLQSRLMELGYLGKATGYYGTETVEAVKAFQARNEITVDGKTGAVTLDRIYSADALPTEELMRQIQRQGTIENFLASARAQLGKPYVWGAAGPSSFDCSGLVTYALRQAGSTTGRLNAAGFSQNSAWQKITNMDNMEPGDLIFYYNSGRSRVGHVGIYVGNGMMVDASSSNGKVVERSCRVPYWESHFVCARRPW